MNGCRAAASDISADRAQPGNCRGRTGRDRGGDLSRRSGAGRPSPRAWACWGVLSHDTSKELRPEEILLIRNARLLQFTAAGVDWVPTRDLPRELPVAANKGGGAEPMSEHIVALALAAAKRLFIEHANLKSGDFNQRSANRMLRGGVCGILGFGNVGVATAGCSCRHRRGRQPTRSATR